MADSSNVYKIKLLYDEVHVRKTKLKQVAVSDDSLNGLLMGQLKLFDAQYDFSFLLIPSLELITVITI